MNKYEVTLKEIEIYVINVEAESEYEAKVKARQILEENGKDKYHNDSDGEAEITDSDE